MDFRLTADQLALQDAIRGYSAAAYPLDGLARLETEPMNRDAWGRLAALDVFRVAVAPVRGGLGLGFVEAAVVYEQLGASLAPGPLTWSAIAPVVAPEFASRAGIVGGLDTADQPRTPALIEYGRDVDALVLLRDDGVYVADGDELVILSEGEDVTPTDPLTPVVAVTRLPHGRRVADAGVADHGRRLGALLAAALLVGLGQRALDTAVAYANERQQFGRPIGSFQAIKHLLADMYVRTAMARSATYAAAAIADDAAGDELALAAANAKLLAADAAIRNARACIQAHGGMGFTWAMIPHYLLKRAWVLEHSFGTRAQHTELIARRLATEVAP